MKILSENKYANYTLIISLSVFVVLMISSFIIRLSEPPISSELADNIEKTNEMETVIQVNIFNACGKDGLAKQVKEHLVQRGFDVKFIDNYGEYLDNSIVIDRMGDNSSSTKVAYAMGIDQSCVTTDIDSSQLVRATIIIGKDYFTLKPFANGINNVVANLQ